MEQARRELEQVRRDMVSQMVAQLRVPQQAVPLSVPWSPPPFTATTPWTFFPVGPMPTPPPEAEPEGEPRTVVGLRGWRSMGVSAFWGVALQGWRGGILREVVSPMAECEVFASRRAQVVSLLRSAAELKAAEAWCGGQHKVPGWSCGCGYYAMYDPFPVGDAAMLFTGRAGAQYRVLVCVEAVGRTIKCEDGWRAERYQVKGIVDLGYMPRGVVMALRERFRVPVVSVVELLEGLFDEHRQA